MKTLVIVTLSLSLVACSNLSTNNYNSESLEHVRQHDMSRSGDNHRDSDFSSSSSSGGSGVGDFSSNANIGAD